MGWNARGDGLMPHGPERLSAAPETRSARDLLGPAPRPHVQWFQRCAEARSHPGQLVRALVGPRDQGRSGELA
jgi:hypothetical protein